MHHILGFIKDHFIIIVPVVTLISIGGIVYHTQRANKISPDDQISTIYPQDTPSDDTGDDTNSDAKPSENSKVESTQKSKISYNTTQSSQPVSKPPRTVVKKLSPAPSKGHSGSGQSDSGYTSQNWSGYIANKKSTSYTSVSATWTIPHSTGTPGKESISSPWIGIGGKDGNDLIQIGTMSQIDKNGNHTIYAFYEMLPSLSQRITSLNINAGDVISASIKEVSANKWEIYIADQSTSQNFSKAVNYTSDHSSAEWIEEVPAESVNGELLRLSDFGSISFNNAYTTANGTEYSLTESEAEKITMITENAKAVPSSIKNGTNFTVTYKPK